MSNKTERPVQNQIRGHAQPRSQGERERTGNGVAPCFPFSYSRKDGTQRASANSCICQVFFSYWRFVITSSCTFINILQHLIHFSELKASLILDRKVTKKPCRIADAIVVEFHGGFRYKMNFLALGWTKICSFEKERNVKSFFCNALKITFCILKRVD